MKIQIILGVPKEYHLSNVLWIFGSNEEKGEGGGDLTVLFLFCHLLLLEFKLKKWSHSPWRVSWLNYTRSRYWSLSLIIFLLWMTCIYLWRDVAVILPNCKLFSSTSSWCSFPFSSWSGSSLFISLHFHCTENRELTRK